MIPARVAGVPSPTSFATFSTSSDFGFSISARIVAFVKCFLGCVCFERIEVSIIGKSSFSCKSVGNVSICFSSSLSDSEEFFQPLLMYERPLPIKVILSFSAFTVIEL